MPCGFQPIASHIEATPTVQKNREMENGPQRDIYQSNLRGIRQLTANQGSALRNWDYVSMRRLFLEVEDQTYCA